MTNLETGFDSFHPIAGKKEELGSLSDNTDIDVQGLINVFECKPTDDITIDAEEVGKPGQIIHLMVEGGENKTLTMGDNFIAEGTLGTGDTSDRMFVLTFVSDGNLFYEVSRTSAMDIS
ncbi:MAG: hypothetical protein ACOCTT_03785 [archaeon]